MLVQNRGMQIVKKSVLVHSCCAHCTAYTVNYWQRQGYEATVYWYNPNIHPYLEHQHRLAAMKSLTQEMNLPIVIADGYDMVSYFRQVAGHEEKRCQYCFQIRLSKTAETARQTAFNAFTTTLLISPHQKHDLLQEIGNQVAEETSVDFLYADLRKRYSDSRRMTKGLNLHRQQYCGCIYSEWERYTTKRTTVQLPDY